MQKANMLKAKR